MQWLKAYLNIMLLVIWRTHPQLFTGVGSTSYLVNSYQWTHYPLWRVQQCTWRVYHQDNDKQLHKMLTENCMCKFCKLCNLVSKEGRKGYHPYECPCDVVTSVTASAPCFLSSPEIINHVSRRVHRVHEFVLSTSFSLLLVHSANHIFFRIEFGTSFYHPLSLSYIWHSQKNG